MQEVRPVQRDLHPAGQQLGVVRLLRPRGERLVVGGRQHQLHVHARQRRDPQCAERGVVGHEVGRGQHHLVARQVDQRVDGVARVLEGVGGSAGQQLRGHILRLHGQVGTYVKPFPGLDVPVAGEHAFQVRDHRPLYARDELAIRMARHERGLRQVLRPHVADAVVDHRDLAVVAQVHPAAAPPPQAARQHVVHHHAGCAQAGAVCAQPALGAHGIQQHAAGHAARGGRAQRGRDGVAHRVVEHQVVQQVHLPGGRADVVQQRTQRRVVIIQQRHRIAMRGHEGALAFDQRGHLGRGTVARRPAQGAERTLFLADHIGGARLPRDTLTRKPGMPQQQVQRQAEQRHEAHQQQPAARRGRGGAAGDPPQRRQPDQPVDDQQRGAEGPVHAVRISGGGNALILRRRTGK